MTHKTPIPAETNSTGSLPSQSSADRRTLEDAGRSLDGQGKKRFWRILPFLGPAFIASVAYVDPGNFATNIQSGSEFGYMLLWVVVASNLMAMLIQTLSAKLGIATGKNLAELCRERFGPKIAFCMWILMELVRHTALMGRRAHRTSYIHDSQSREVRVPSAGSSHRDTGGLDCRMLSC